MKKHMVIGADHAGYSLKEALKTHLQAQGWTVDDVGCGGETDRVDYPSLAEKTLTVMQEKHLPRAVLCCGSGVGMSMAANRFPWVRAVLAHDVTLAEMSRRHNDSNVLCMGGRFIAPELAICILTTWLDTPFEGERHQRRVDQLSDIGKPKGKTACST